MERLRLYYPIRPYLLNQRFGDNLPCVKDFGLPTQSVVTGSDNKTCPPDYSKLYEHWNMDGHNGGDLNAGEQNVYASAKGTVVEKQTVPARGFGLGILTDEKVYLDDFGEHYAKIRYWHLKKMYVEVGDKVEVGQLIGVTDNTGYSSGNHLHFELQPMDKDAGGHPILTFPSPSARKGVIASAIDPIPFLVGIYADTVPQQISALRQLLIVLAAQLQELLKKK